MKLKYPLVIISCLLITSIAGAMGGKPKMPETIYAEFQTNQGNFTCLLYPKSAPKTVANFVKLAQKPFYDGTCFHRVIPDFIIQGGDPLGNSTGGPGYQFEDEIDPVLMFSNPGTLAMANAGPNTNGSQFFITVAPTPWLNGKHTIFGRVVEGYEVVDAISKVKAGTRDKPIKDVVLQKVVINPHTKNFGVEIK